MVAASGFALGIHQAATHCSHTHRQYRLLQQLDELIVLISGQAHVQYPSVVLGTCSIQLIKTPMCVIGHVHIPVHTPVALAAPMQQLNALHRYVICTHPVISLMTYTGDDIH